MRERIFDPLGMTDTSFTVKGTKLERFATSYWTNFKTGAFEACDEARDGQWSRPPAFRSGAGGLVSTVDDYLAFSLMMPNKGKHGRERYGWDGGLGTSWYVDPTEERVTILMTQRAWTSPSPPDVSLDFWTTAYQAIDD